MPKMNYTPTSLHEAMTWLLGLPIDASARDMAKALRTAAAKAKIKEASEKGKSEPGEPMGKEPDSHMILTTAIGSPEAEWAALDKLADVADKVASKKKTEHPQNIWEERRLKTQ